MTKQLFSAGLLLLFSASLHAAEPFLLFHDQLATDRRESAPLDWRVIPGSHEDATCLESK